MCGRATVLNKAGVEAIAVEFHAKFNPADWRARFNIRPTESIPVLRFDDAGQLELTELSWWLVPSWSKERLPKFPTFNARAETVADKASFRDAFRKRRCLIVVDGFYEWPKKPSRDRRPRLIRMQHRGPFTIAGLWDRWTDYSTGELLESCAVVTTAANPLLASVPHDRMPVILDGEARHRWLAADTAAAEAQSLLVPRAVDGMDLVVVSDQFVNHGVDDERCIAEVDSASASSAEPV